MNGHHGGRVHDANNPHTPSSCSEDSDDGEWRDNRHHFSGTHGPHGANKRFKISWENPRYGRYGGMYGEFGGFGFAGRNRDRELHRQRHGEIFLSAPPALHRGCAKPLCFWSRREEQEFVVISSSFMNIDGGCIYKYDYLNDSWDRFRKYNAPLFKPYNAGHAINPKTNELYIFGGVHKIFGLFDLEHGQKGSEKIYDISKHEDMTYWFPVSIFIRNELHILAEIDGRALHSIYFPSSLQISKHFFGAGTEDDRDGGDNKLLDYTQDHEAMHAIKPIFYGAKVVYVQHTREILLFNGHNSNIYIWSYSVGDRKWRLWRSHSTEYIVLPKKNTNNFDVQIVHDAVIMICYLSSKEVWAKNIINDSIDAKWYRKSVKQFMGITPDSHMVSTVDDHYMHFINTIVPKHCMIWTYLLLPRRIVKRGYAPMVAHHQLSKLMRKSKHFKKSKMEIPQRVVTLVSNYCVNVFY